MTRDEIRAALRAELERNQADDELGHRIHVAIAGVLTKFEGKKLTKRFTDKASEAIKALFPGQHPCVSWEHPGKCSVWVHDTIPFNDRLLFYVAPTCAPTEPAYHGHWIGECHAAGFEREDACHSQPAVDRIAKRTAILNPEPRRSGCQVTVLDDLAALVERVRTAWEKLDAYGETIPGELSELRYETKRLTDLNKTYGRG